MGTKKARSLLLANEKSDLDRGVELLRTWARENLDFEQAIYMFAVHKIAADSMFDLFEESSQDHKSTIGLLRFSNEQTRYGAEMLRDAAKTLEAVPGLWKESVSTAIKLSKAKASKRGKAAADALHSKPGGNREKRTTIQATWASGKYSSRDVCAEQECSALGMSFATARKALRNTPEPT